jgi:tripartite-type tricarboxylate transporter receptor subunit TctC
MKSTRRFSLAALAAWAVLTCISSRIYAAPAADSQFPQRPVRIIVPTGPAGGSDFITRLMATRLAERWGQNVVVENRPAASGLVACELLARSLPDGHTLAVINPGAVVAAQASGKLSFARDGDFTPIAYVANSAQLLVINPALPANTLKEFVDLARSKPRGVYYGSAGNGSVIHLSMELFAAMNGIELTHVPYQGGPATLPDVISGRTQATMTTIPVAVPHVQAGRMRALAITGAKRLPAFPDVPTFAEAGYPKYRVTFWFGVFGPARMPPALVARLNTDLNAVLRQPTVVERFTSAAYDVAGDSSAPQFADYIAGEIVSWNEAVKAAGMR